MENSLADFLSPDGYAQPGLLSLTRELTVWPEAGRAVARSARSCGRRPGARGVDRIAGSAGEPVLLVPGFLAGDHTLRVLGRELRAHGYRTYGSQIHSNVSCLLSSAAHLEQRLEEIAERHQSRVRVVGHSLGGMLARALAVRRPDLVSGIVTLGSPMMAPGTAHPVLLSAAEVLVRLSRLGVPGLMNESCIGGDCALLAWRESRQPVPDGVGFTCIWSRGDGLVDPASCVDPLSRAVEVRASHLGMVIDPRVTDVVLAELAAQRHHTHAHSA